MWLVPGLVNVFATRVGLGVRVRVCWCGCGGLRFHVCLLSVLWQEVVCDKVTLLFINEKGGGAFKSALDAGLLVLCLGAEVVR